MKKLIQLICVMVACALLYGGVPTAAAVTGGFGGKPANPDPAIPRSKDIFIYTLKKGDTTSDEVVITNNTDIAQTIVFYPTDADISNTGAFTCKQRVEPRNDIGSWITLSQSEVTLEPGTNTKVPFNVAVPQGVEPGEHNGCLAFEPKGDQGQVEGNVRIHTRSAVRVAVTIPGNLNRNIDITSFSVATTMTGQWNFKLSVKNTGNVSADTNMSVQLHSLFGQKLYQNEGTYPVIAGNKYDVNYVDTNTAFWGGFYRASAAISYDKNPSRFVNPDMKKNESIVTKHASDRYIFIAPNPIALLLYGIVLILIAGAIGYWLYRRRETADALRNWHHYTIKEGDTIQSVADQHDTSWKKLAKINDLKAPYTLIPSEKIQVPNKKK